MRIEQNGSNIRQLLASELPNGVFHMSVITRWTECRLSQYEPVMRRVVLLCVGFSLSIGLSGCGDKESSQTRIMETHAIKRTVQGTPGTWTNAIQRISEGVNGNLDIMFEDMHFTCTILKVDVPKFGHLKELVGKKIQITGSGFEVDPGYVMLILNDPSQLKILE